MITEDQRRYYRVAAEYLLDRREQGNQNNTKAYPLNRGDILLLVVLLEQELKSDNPCADPNRLAAVREKLGDLVPDAPEMSKAEARQFTE